MSKQVLDIQQMLHLKELSVDTDKASMAYIINITDKYNPFLCLNSDAIDHVDFYNYALGAFTLQDILDLLPSTIDTETTDEINEYWLEFGVSERNKSYWFVQYRSVDDKIYVNRDMGTLIDSAYEMLCWCIENGYVKTNKED